MSRRELEAALRRDHRDEDLWTVYADLLAASGDVRGELIHLEQRASSSTNLDDGTRWRDQAKVLFDRSQRALLGPVADVKVEFEWFRGFVMEAVIRERYAWVTEQLLAREVGALMYWLTYLDLSRCDEVAEVIAGSWVDTIELRSRRDLDLGPLARVVGLRELILEHSSTTGLDQLAGLERLERLLVRATPLRFEPFAEGFAGLRHLQSAPGYLSRWNRPVLDLRPLTNLTQLEVLELPGEAVEDIGPLIELQELREVDLSATRVQSIEPLVMLPKLERVILDGLGGGFPDSVARLRERGVEVVTQWSR